MLDGQLRQKIKLKKMKTTQTMSLNLIAINIVWLHEKCEKNSTKTLNESDPETYQIAGSAGVECSDDLLEFLDTRGTVRSIFLGFFNLHSI